ncbi:malate/lactate/ureidoglycolate dehydrogenase [Telmatospirillum siberiense]|uniref:Malate/lactate/ureidoglycolate dehydrogenase n=1 Tax=Telmatospirillum siberiense TaxID=382514 RepID=A0A2N3PZC2_9PROT|nr:malate/lactate/ureidoglycolate dehydrogenase [Telmatospirillum siberiense]PKU25711.1 malate/lactate/ureidoglycolate dehydrogenase [Telmatospirillum siberiense]
MPRFSPTDLQASAAEIIRLAGSSPEEADIVASNLVEANLQGHDSHGVGMIPHYVAALRQGGLKANTPVKLLADHGAILVFDGQQGYGQVVTRQTMEAGIERARTTGVCVTSLKNSHHLGRVGAWAEQCAAAGLVSIHFVNAFFRPLVAPFNGIDPKLGTNPFCVGVPRIDRHPLILDFATSAIALGKARVAYNTHKPLAPDVVIDAQGKPTTDPACMIEPPLGALLPFGKHKGGGLALICALLGAALTGSPTERLTKSGDMHILNGMLSIIINPAMLGGAESFEDEIEAFLPWVRESRPITGEVLFPGEPEQRRKAIRAKDGIDVDDETWRQLVEARASLAS